HPHQRPRLPHPPRPHQHDPAGPSRHHTHPPVDHHLTHGTDSCPEKEPQKPALGLRDHERPERSGKFGTRPAGTSRPASPCAPLSGASWNRTSDLILIRDAL